MKRFILAFLVAMSLGSWNMDQASAQDYLPTIFKINSDGWFYFVEGEGNARMHFLYMNGVYPAISGTIDKDNLKRFIRKAWDQLPDMASRGNAIDTWLDSAIFWQIMREYPKWEPYVRKLGFKGPYTDNEIINMWSK